MCEIYNPLLALGIMSLTSYQNTRRTSTPFSQQSNLRLNRIKRRQTPLTAFTHFHPGLRSRALTRNLCRCRGRTWARRRLPADLSRCCQASAEKRMQGGLLHFLNVFEEIENFSTPAMQKINSEGHEKAEISVNNSVNFPCFEEVRLLARSNGK